MLSRFIVTIVRKINIAEKDARNFVHDEIFANEFGNLKKNKLDILDNLDSLLDMNETKLYLKQDQNNNLLVFWIKLWTLSFD